jgi:hypothetical protein
MNLQTTFLFLLNGCPPMICVPSNRSRVFAKSQFPSGLGKVFLPGTIKTKIYGGEMLGLYYI